MEKITMKEVIEQLMESEIGKYSDSYNYMIILIEENGNLKPYQICVENDEEDKVIYLSEYNLFTEEVGETWDIEDLEPYNENTEVIAITEVIEI